MTFVVSNKIICFKEGFNKNLTKRHVDKLKKLISKGYNELHIKDEDGERYEHSINLIMDVPGIEILHLCDYHLPITKLPPNLKEFYSGNFFHQKIEFNFPDSIKKLVFGFRFNQSIENYPKNLKQLEFSAKFNKPIDNLPIGLESLYINGNFNQTIDNLPSTLKKISFFGIYPSQFNQPIDNLPVGLEELYLFWDFNQPIDMLPANLQIIYLSSSFNQPLNNLPSNLKKIVFPAGGKFNHKIDNFPDSIEEIELPNEYDQDIKKYPKNYIESYNL